MRKKSIKSLSLKKVIISNFNISKVKGGTVGEVRTGLENECTSAAVDIND